MANVTSEEIEPSLGRPESLATYEPHRNETFDFLDMIESLKFSLDTPTVEKLCEYFKMTNLLEKTRDNETLQHQFLLQCRRKCIITRKDTTKLLEAFREIGLPKLQTIIEDYNQTSNWPSLKSTKAWKMNNQTDDFETRMANYIYGRPLHGVRDYGIVLAGKTGCGKSSTGNTILGRTAFRAHPSGESVTSVSSYATSEYGDRTITVVDTPGMYSNVLSSSGMEQEFARMAYLLREGVHCFVICMNANEVRLTTKTKQFLDQVKVSGHDDFLDYCMLVYTKPEAELCDISLDEFVEKQKKYADMKSFLEKIGGRVLAVNNKASDPRERERNKDAIIAMVDKVIEDNIIRKNPILFTNDTFEKAKELREQVVSVVARGSCHPSLVNAVIESVIWSSNRGTISEEKFVDKVFNILCNSEQCEKDGSSLIFKNDTEFTNTPVVTCREQIKMIYQATNSYKSSIYTFMTKLLFTKRF